jgi:hypothetical protein
MLKFWVPQGAQRARAQGSVSILPHMYSTPYLRGWFVGLVASWQVVGESREVMIDQRHAGLLYYILQCDM